MRLSHSTASRLGVSSEAAFETVGTGATFGACCAAVSWAVLSRTRAGRKKRTVCRRVVEIVIGSRSGGSARLAFEGGIAQEARGHVRSAPGLLVGLEQRV